MKNTFTQKSIRWGVDRNDVKRQENVFATDSNVELSIFRHLFHLFLRPFVWIRLDEQQSIFGLRRSRRIYKTRRNFSQQSSSSWKKNFFLFVSKSFAFFLSVRLDTNKKLWLIVTNWKWRRQNALPGSNSIFDVFLDRKSFPFRDQAIEEADAARQLSREQRILNFESILKTILNRSEEKSFSRKSKSNRKRNLSPSLFQLVEKEIHRSVNVNRLVIFSKTRSVSLRNRILLLLHCRENLRHRQRKNYPIDRRLNVRKQNQR